MRAAVPDPASRSSLRTRLVLWLVALLTTTLVLFAATLFLTVRHGLWGEFDLRLQHEVDSARSVLAPYWTIDGISAPEFISPLPGHDRRWLEVWSPQARLLFQSPQAAAMPLAGIAPPTGSTARIVGTDTAGMRALDSATDIIGLPVVIRVAEPDAPIRAQIRAIALSIAIGLVACVAIAIWSGYALIRRALRPLQALVSQTSVITADRLRHGIRIDGADQEVNAVAAAFNDALRRLHVSFEQAQRFSADASHELRTPLTSMRAVGQLALQQPQSPDQYRDAIASMVEEVERIARLLDALLLLSRADAQQIQPARRPLALDALVRDVAAEFQVLAEEKQQSLNVEVAGVGVEGDAEVLRLAIDNLLDNAIRHTPAGGGIAVTVMQEGPLAVMQVRDTGPGIAPEHHAQLFDRFYRVDDMRARQSGGTGLGLSIAAWAALAHGGRITLDSAPGAGSTFRLEMPAAVNGRLRP